jgi:HEAT repeat protein
MPTFQLDQMPSSHLILITMVGLGILATALSYTGVVEWFFKCVQILVRWAVRQGFLTWQRLFSWAEWPIFLFMEFGFLVVGIAMGGALPGLTIALALVPLLMGVTACLAYVFIDLERYEVERGYKAVHNPMKGQDLAHHYSRFGHQVGVPLLAASALGIIGGFSLLNLGLYLGPGHNWYRIADQATFPEFLAFSLINIYSIVDLLDLANNQKLLRVAHISTAAWPASTLVVTFKVFFTFVLLQQIFSSLRKGKLLIEMITDFWSPHEPIRERARTALPQYGVIAIRPLLRSLRSVSALTKEQRDQLPQVLATIGPSAIPLLVRHLKDEHEFVRAVVIAALGQLRTLEAVPYVAELCDDPVIMVRQCVAEALGNLCSACEPTPLSGKRQLPSNVGLGWSFWWRKRDASQPAIDPLELAMITLRRALGDDASPVRIQAARSLGRSGLTASKEAPNLIALLKDPEESVRCVAAEALGKLGDVGAEEIDALVEMLHDPSSKVKASAARALGSMKKLAARAVEEIIPLLQDREEEVRTAAADAIALVGALNEQATESLVEGLASKDNVIQAQTAQALATIGSAAKDAAPALVEALGKGSDRVRAKAAQALGKIGEAAAEVAVPSLVKALRGKDNWTSALAAEALGEMGESADEAVPALVQCLRSGNPLVRANAAEALGKMGSAAAGAAQALEKAACDEDGAVRCRAVLALGKIDRPNARAEKVLMEALKDPDPLVRAAGIESIGQCGQKTEAVWNALLPLLNDSNDEVKVKVVQVLPRLCGPRTELIDGLCDLLSKNDSPLVQTSAALALGKMGPAAAAAGPILLHMAQTGEESLREQAMRAIAMVQPSEIAQAFAIGIRDSSPHIRMVASAFWIKSEKVPEEAVAALVDSLRDPEIQVRINAAQALSRLEQLPSKAIALLVTCTEDANDNLRLHAAVALQKAPPAAVSKTMRTLVADPNIRVRLIAAGNLLTSQGMLPAGVSIVKESLADASASVRNAAMQLIESLGSNSISLLQFLQKMGSTVPEGEQDPATASGAVTSPVPQAKVEDTRQLSTAG